MILFFNLFKKPYKEQLTDLREIDSGIKLDAPLSYSDAREKLYWDAKEKWIEGITKANVAIADDLQFYEESGYGGTKLNEHAKLLSAPEAKGYSCQHHLYTHLQFVGRVGYYCQNCMERVV